MRIAQRASCMAAVLLIALVAGHAIGASAPQLTGMTPVAGGFRLTLTGETNVAYVIQASTNLQSWFPVVTNRESSASRSVDVSAFGPRCVYRAVSLLPTFGFPLATLDLIDMNGNNLSVDSFDSSDPNASTNGRYDVTKRKYNGVVAGIRGLTNSINVGNAEIRGQIWTGPRGAARIGPNGKVGDATWFADSSKKGFQSGSLRDDLKLEFLPVNPPFSSGLTPGPGEVEGEFYDYVLGSGNYQMASLTLTADESMIVVGDAVLYVTADLSVSGNAYIRIRVGARLRLYVASPIAILGGNGIVNDNHAAAGFVYYGLPSNTDATLGGAGDFTGCVYAPEARLRLNGGGSSSYFDLVGSIVSKKIIFGGHISIHYDESLRGL